ncbi:AMP-binding protein [Aliarcobacter cryaerophilus]|uniref:AMP-binding protein n=1 Tax=Aliarcobacter TaxID=2321111 RepID=UPI0029B9DC56|nr:AMP-binding protein [Aliarcobacter skirrowii]MDX4050854.1 AMP-binding protein [Aliarcobacter skirrowii]
MNLEKYSNNTCLVTKSETLTYDDLLKESKKIESLLSENKNLILIKSKCNIETIVGYIASLRSNSTVIMLDSDLDEELTNNITTTYLPNFIWESIDECCEDYIYKYKDYGLKIHSKSKINLHKDLALMLSTSGSTGSPKMVKLTKNNICSNTNSIVNYLNLDNKSVPITNLPLHYSFGLSILNTHLSVGSKIVVTEDSIMSKDFWELFNINNVTTLSGVPYTFDILKKIGFFKMKLPSLKYITQAGGKLNSKLIEEYYNFSKANNIKFYVMYGQTEATARISYLPYSEVMTKNMSIGIAIPDGELYIQNLETKEKIEKTYESGELVYKGSNVMMGYANNLDDLSTGDTMNSTLFTGDLAYKDEDNYFYITGRIKRFIKIFGNRISLDEIENHLKSISFDVICTGEDNKIIVYTVNADDIEPIKLEIIKKYKLHHSTIIVKYIDKFPVSNSGKIQYQDLLKEYNNGN